MSLSHHKPCSTRFLLSYFVGLNTNLAFLQAKIKYWTCADMVHWGIKDASCATIDREWQDPNKVRAPATPSPGVSRQPPSGAQGRTKQTTKRAPRNVPKEVSSIVIPDKLSGKCIIPEPDKLKPKSVCPFPTQ